MEHARAVDSYHGGVGAERDGFEIRQNVFKDSPDQQAYCNQSILFGMYPDEPYTFSNDVIDNNTFEDCTGWGIDLDRVTSGSVQPRTRPA